MSNALRRVLRGKIHRLKVTHADLHYEGSITLPPDLMEACGLVEYEAVHIWNVTNGERFETYAMRGQPESRDVAINGAAARRAAPGDIVIVAAFMQIEEKSLKDYAPRLVFVDGDNNLLPSRHEVPGPSVSRSALGPRG